MMEFYPCGQPIARTRPVREPARELTNGGRPITLTLSRLVALRLPSESRLMNPAAPFCPGPLSRRHFLKVGSLTLGALGFNGLLPLKVSAEDGHTRDDTAVILVWLPGGPPHMETYD